MKTTKHKIRYCLLALLAFVLGLNPRIVLAQQPEKPFDFDQELEKTSRLIVMLRAEFEGTPEFGAGIIFGRQPGRLLIVTAYHLLHRGPAQPQHIRVQLSAKPDKLLDATLLRHEEALDLAVLSVDVLDKRGIDVCALPFDRLGQVATLKRGNGVFAVGNPNGVPWAVPVVADRISQLLNNQIVFQSAFISSGHSGGALLDEQAHIVGMTTADQPPFGRAVNIDTILGLVKRWEYPVHVHPILGFGRTPLHLAAQSGYIAAIRDLLANCGDPNAMNDGKATPLHFAAQSGNVAALSLLLHAGANLEAQDKSKDTPLHWAGREGQLENIKFLLKAGAKINSRGEHGFTPLHVALLKGHLEIAKFLVGAGADLNVLDDNQSYGLRSPLGMAAHEGQVEMTSFLLRAGARVDAKVLYHPVSRGNVEIVKMLLKVGTRADGKTRFPTEELLHVAVQSGNLEVIKLLVAAGADVNTLDDQKRTPLLVAISSNKGIAIEDFLVAHGGSIKGATAEQIEMNLWGAIQNAVTNRRVGVTRQLLAAEGVNPKIHYFSHHGSLPLLNIAIEVEQQDGEIVDMLVKAGADVRQEYRGMTPLQSAAKMGNAAVINVLLAAGLKADESGWQRYGSTPLKLAVYGGHVDAASVLLKAGANVNASYRSSPYTSSPDRLLEVAVRKGQVDMVKLLLAAGADVNAKTSNNTTLLSIALELGNKAVVELLQAHGAKQ